MSERDDLIADLLALVETAGATSITADEIDELLAQWAGMLRLSDYADKLDRDVRFWLDNRDRLQSSFDVGDEAMRAGWHTLQVLPAQEIVDAYAAEAA
jgi:hypothetical protein